MPSDEYWWPTASDLQGQGKSILSVHYIGCILCADLVLYLLIHCSSGRLISLFSCNVILRLSMIDCLCLFAVSDATISNHPLSLELPSVQTPGLCVN